MIISPARRFVFIHPPKTGGTAISLAYEARAHKDDLLFGDTPKAKRRQGNFNRKHPEAKLSKHSPAPALSTALPDVDFTGWTVAMTVRNPWDRVVSFYAWARAQSFEHPMIAAAKSQDFATFLQDPRVANPFKRGATPAYAAPFTPRLLRHERLEADWQALCADLGLAPSLLPRVNTSDRTSDWRPYYTEATADLIPELFRWEVESLGYRFDPQ